MRPLNSDLSQTLKVFLSIALACIFSLPSNAQDLNFNAYRNSPLQGLSSVILDEAYGYLNIPIHVSPYVKRPESINDGEVSQTIDYEKTLEDHIRITEPVNYLEPTVFSKSLKLDIQDWESLSPHLIGIPLGARHTEMQTRQMQRIMVPSYRQLFAMLEQNRLELIVSPLIEGLFAMRQTRLTHLMPLDTKLERVELYHYLHKRHAALAPHIEKALKVMRENGRIETLREQFIARLRSL